MPADVITTIREMRERVAAARRVGRRVGLVPTMGALHAGHGALIEQARAGCDYLVVSVFVNPIQFDREDDFEAYARNLTADVEHCSARGADAPSGAPADILKTKGRTSHADPALLSRGIAAYAAIFNSPGACGATLSAARVNPLLRSSLRM